MEHEILTVHPPMVFPSLSFFGGSRAFLRFFARLAYVACSCNLACFSFSFTGSLRGNQVLFRFCGSARFRPSAAKYFIRAGSLKSAEERYSSDNALAFSASVMMDNWYSSYRNIFLQKWTNTFQLVTNSGDSLKQECFSTISEEKLLFFTSKRKQHISCPHASWDPIPTQPTCTKKVFLQMGKCNTSHARSSSKLVHVSETDSQHKNNQWISHGSGCSSRTGIQS